MPTSDLNQIAARIEHLATSCERIEKALLGDMADPGQPGLIRRMERVEQQLRLARMALGLALTGLATTVWAWLRVRFHIEK